VLFSASDSVLELKENYLKQCYAVRQCYYIYGAESMRGDLPWNGFIADDIETFVMKSIQLYQDEDFGCKPKKMVSK
jgi:hypothetical protein